MPTLTIGRLVRYVLDDGDVRDPAHAGAVIPAIVVAVHDDGLATLTGFPDFKALGLLPCLSLVERRVHWPPKPGTWHWPPELQGRELRERAKAAKAVN